MGEVFVPPLARVCTKYEEDYEDNTKIMTQAVKHFDLIILLS